MKKQKTQTWYRKKCVEIAKKKAKERDNNICVWCGRDGREYQIHGSHIFPEGKYHGMSANIENIVAHCAVCHWRWHESPVEGVEWFKKKYPKRYEKLKKLSQQTIKTDWKKEYETSLALLKKDD